MYGMNKKAYKPVIGGMKVQKPVAPNSGSGLSFAAAKNSMEQASMRKQAIRKLRGA